LKAAEEFAAAETAAETKSVEEEADTAENDVANPESEDVAMVIDESTSESAPQVLQFLDTFSFK